MVENEIIRIRYMSKQEKKYSFLLLIFFILSIIYCAIYLILIFNNFFRINYFTPFIFIGNFILIIFCILKTRKFKTDFILERNQFIPSMDISDFIFNRGIGRKVPIQNVTMIFDIKNIIILFIDKKSAYSVDIPEVKYNMKSDDNKVIIKYLLAQNKNIKLLKMKDIEEYRKYILNQYY